MEMSAGVWRGVAVITISAALVACGGGADEPCGAQSQSFGVSFEPSVYTLKVGQLATITSKVIPESCRSEMHFSATTNGIPPGMALQRGNVTGTPTQAGIYEFQLTMTSVDGYLDFLTISRPRSNKVTVLVSP
jgi:hypothetical protein